MTMSVGEVVQAVGALAIAAGAGYWGGQVKAMLRKLCDVTSDHEQRIRGLEQGAPPRS